jgi:hypothetical protein
MLINLYYKIKYKLFGVLYHKGKTK